MTIYSSSNPPPHYYIYAYIRKDHISPYYIGKGKGKRAWLSHKKVGVPKETNRIVIMEANLTEIGAYALERRYIRWYGRKCDGSGILINRSLGGEYPSGFKHSEKAKKQMSEKAKGRTAYNKGIPNPKQRQKMLRDNPMKNPDIAKKVGSKLKGRPSPMRGKNYKPSNPVKYGKDGKKKTIWTFADGTIQIVDDTRKMCEKLGLSYSAVRHKIGKGPYTKGKYTGLSISRYDYNSQEPLTHASSCVPSVISVVS